MSFSKIRLFVKIVSLGGDFVSKLKLIELCLLFYIKKSGEWKKDLYIKINKNRYKIFLDDVADIFLLKEILIDEDYKFPQEKNPKTILDLGSNIGLSVIYLKNAFLNAHIYAFEPDPLNFDLLKKNTKDLKDITAINIAVGDKDGESSFFTFDNRKTSASLINRSPNSKETKVKTETLETIIRRNKIERIDILKFDIEGAEDRIFESIKSNSNIIESIIGEIHLDILNKELEDVLVFFTDYNIEIVETGKKRFIIKGLKKNNIL